MKAGVIKGAAHPGVGAFPFSTGETVFQETRLEQGLKHADQRMMHHPVTEGRGGDDALLGFVNLEVAVGTARLYHLKVLLQTKL